MGRGEYGHNVGQLTEPALSPEIDRGTQAFDADLGSPRSPRSPLENVNRLEIPTDPWAASMPPQKRPWTEAQKKDFQRALGLSTLGSVAGAVLWKSHRIWGFILGGMAGGGLANVIFAPTSFENQ